MDGIFHGQDSLVQSHQKIFVVQSVMHIYVNTKQNFHSLAYIFCSRCASLIKTIKTSKKLKPKNWLKCTKTNNMHTHIE